VTDPQSVFSALADPTRRAVFEHLTSEGPASASALAARLPVSRQAIAKHLAVLDDAGLVTRAAAGREVQYRADPKPLADITEWAARVDAQWKERLDRLYSQVRGRS
jgi:DNA-binding transcriptional ArsR family regulator